MNYPDCPECKGIRPVVLVEMWDFNQVTPSEADSGCAACNGRALRELVEQKAKEKP